MIDLHVLLAFITAVTALMLVPGPNVALIVANSVAYGPRYGLLTVAGTSSAMVLQLTLVGLGMAKILGAAGIWFEWLRWIGVAYLLYLGLMQWRSAPVDLTITKPQPRSKRAVFMRGLLVSLTNPKILFFYGAFFPQFIDPAHDVGRQAIVLSTTFLIVALVVDSLWALLGGRASFLLARHGRLRNRLSGSVLIGAGLSLAALRGR
jgi:threonine/homoserine/homoserine lactone efflux protein